MALKLLDQLAVGTSVLARFEGLTLDELVATALAGFEISHAKLEKSVEEVERTCRIRDAALAAVGECDAGLDVVVTQKLPVQLIGAGLGSRLNPFSRYSKYSPAVLVSLGYLKEVAEVRELVANVAARGPSEEITKTLAECLQHATKIEKAIEDSTGPQRDYDFALAARDQAAMEWSKAFAKLKVRASLAFEDQPQVLETLFDNPRRIDRPITRRKKKTATPEAPESPDSQD